MYTFDKNGFFKTSLNYNNILQGIPFSSHTDTKTYAQFLVSSNDVSTLEPIANDINSFLADSSLLYHEQYPLIDLFAFSASRPTSININKDYLMLIDNKYFREYFAQVQNTLKYIFSFDLVFNWFSAFSSDHLNDILDTYDVWELGEYTFDLVKTYFSTDSDNLNRNMNGGLYWTLFASDLYEFNVSLKFVIVDERYQCIYTTWNCNYICKDPYIKLIGYNYSS